MQIKITYKASEKLCPNGSVYVFTTPYPKDEELDEWQCGFDYEPHSNRYFLSLKRGHVSNTMSKSYEMKEFRRFLVESNVDWETYEKYLSRKIEKIEIDGRMYWGDYDGD